MTTVKEYIERYKKIRIDDNENDFHFWSNGKDVIGGRFKKGKGRVL